LHDALASEKRAERPTPDTRVGPFVDGTTFVEGPGFQSVSPKFHRIFDVVAAECKRQTQVVHAFRGADTHFLPVVLVERGGVVLGGSVIDAAHARRNVAASYSTYELHWFGIMESVLEGIPLCTLLFMRSVHQ
jgi:hypothetical protein